MTKDMIKMAGTYYIASKGLKRPVIQQISNIHYEQWDYIHQYRDYKIKNITKDEYEYLQITQIQL
jgi:hypothetical protein